MTIKEQLKAAGYTDEQISEIVKIHNGILADSYVPIERFTQVNENLKEANATIATRDTQIKDLSKLGGDAEGLKAEVAKLQKENKEAADNYQKQLMETQISSAIRHSLTGKVHNVDDALGFFDLTKIELDESGRIKTGFDDQFKALKKDKPYHLIPEDSGAKFKGFKPQDPNEEGVGKEGTTKAVEFAKSLAKETLPANTDAADAAKFYNIGGTTQ